ncbi:hypothetical protein Plhal304r1_c017g0061371 [Plasmopara halstedii]
MHKPRSEFSLNQGAVDQIELADMSMAIRLNNTSKLKSMGLSVMCRVRFVYPRRDVCIRLSSEVPLNRSISNYSDV